MSINDRRSLMHGLEKAAAETGGKSGDKKPGRNNAVKVGIAAVALLATGFVLARNLLQSDSIADVTGRKTLVDSETGEVFQDFGIPAGGSFPYTNPKTKKATLYPAEPCFWTKDGRAKLDPTWVLLNEHAGKEGQTTCPDCGKPVKAHNPLPPAELFPK